MSWDCTPSRVLPSSPIMCRILYVVVLPIVNSGSEVSELNGGDLLSRHVLVTTFEEIKFDLSQLF